MTGTPQRFFGASRGSACWRWMLALLLVVVAAGCTTSDDEEEETPTATATAVAVAVAEPPLPSPTAPALTPMQTPRPTSAAPASTLSAADSQTISDGICRATVPNTWVDDGTGRGFTASGHRFELFGGRLSTDADWQRGVDLVLAQAKKLPGTNVEQGDDFVRLVYPDDRGFVHRTRFADRYCDFSVTSAGPPIAAAEQAIWEAIVASLRPAEPR